MDNVTIQLQPNGRLIIPTAIRQKYNIRPGDLFQLIDVDGLLILTPFIPLVPELALEIEKARLNAGLNTDDLLLSLREERNKYVQEVYGY